MQYVEPTYKFPISIGASREMSLSVGDSRKLLVKLVGAERVLERQQLTTYFRSILMANVKRYMAQTMRTNAINVFEIDESLETFSSEIHQRLIPDFLDYGVQLKRFYVTTIVKPDGDPQYETFKDLRFRQYADIAEGAVKNESAGGNFANMGIGLGMMAGVGRTVGGAVNNMVSGAFSGISAEPQPTQNHFCDQCGYGKNVIIRKICVYGRCFYANFESSKFSADGKI